MKYIVEVIYKMPNDSSNKSKTCTVEANSDAQAKMEALDKVSSEYKNYLSGKVEVIEARVVSKF